MSFIYSDIIQIYGKKIADVPKGQQPHPLG